MFAKSYSLRPSSPAVEILVAGFPGKKYFLVVLPTGFKDYYCRKITLLPSSLFRKKMADLDHPRLILPSFLSPSLCKELEFIHKSNSTVGYRPNVFSTTLSHLIATNCPQLLLPFIPIRERLRERVEEFFGCEYELFIEFTGLISWCRGASIGWHSDDNRPYLKQRNFAAVCYLNSFGVEFEGGLFHFHDGHPTTIIPRAGDTLIYTADSRNIHSVDEITGGERLTLTLWFTLDRSYDEDAKLIALLSQCLGSHNGPDFQLPFPASSNMYWFSTDSSSNNQSGFDIRWARLWALGFSLHSDDDGNDASVSSSPLDPLELLNRPLKLGRNDCTFQMQFINSLHALQVVQFYFWQPSGLQKANGNGEDNHAMKVSHPSSDRIVISGGDSLLADRIIGLLSHDEDCKLRIFSWVDFSAAVAMWEDYVCKLWKEMMISLPYWSAQQCIYTISNDGN